MVKGCKARRDSLHTPKPGQYVCRKDGNAGSGGDTGERLLCSRFAVSEAIAANHNRNKACDLCDGAGEERLNGSEARIEGRTALSKSGDREKKAYGWNQGGQAHPPMRCLGRLLVNHDPDSAWHWLLQRLQCSRDMPE